ncbi:MAG: T9SS type A sorting domain-containing protein [Ignavibacteriales bacterium]
MMRKYFLTVCFLVSLLSGLPRAQGNVDIYSGCSVEVSGKMDIEVSGNWNNNGTFIPGRGTVIFNGTVPQTITGPSGAAFHNLSVDNQCGILNLQSSILVTGTLSLNSCRINTIFNTVSLARGANLTRKSGYILGTLKKDFSAPDTRTFEVGTLNGYTPVTIKAVEGKGSISVKAIQEPHPNAIGRNVLQRYWSISGEGIAKTDLSFQYLPGDVVGISYEYQLGTYSIGNWNFPDGKLNASKHTASIKGVSDYSGDWTLGKVPSMPVDLSRFTSAAGRSNVTLLWETQSEVNSERFEVERSPLFNETSHAYNWKRIGELQAFGNCNFPQEYVYVDNNLNTGYYAYRLKMIGSRGNYKYSDIVVVEMNRPVTIELSQNYPNPFNGMTAIPYSIPEDTHVILTIYDLNGQLIAQPVNEFKPAGHYVYNFDASNLASGIYICKLNAGSHSMLKKMMLLK